MLPKQQCTLFETDPHDCAIGFGRLVDGDAGKELAF